MGSSLVSSTSYRWALMTQTVTKVEIPSQREVSAFVLRRPSNLRTAVAVGA